jgi:isoleucyl-tRNA synthetase
MKLWNTYAFFCNYARLDDFNPTAPQMPLAQRPDIDRWILSDLQELVKKARESFDTYNLMAFCLEAERFVDDKLSNWYVRRNRRRFWKGEAGSDKLAAYQTLYTVLLTLTKLFAPIMPFLSETIYQNLAAGPDKQVSVHHCPFPTVDESLIDENLSNDMEALLRLVSLGSAARNTKKIKVRQPLAEMRVWTYDETERRAVARFSTQIEDELNIKVVRLNDTKLPAGVIGFRLNPKTAGEKFGADRQIVSADLFKVIAVLGQSGDFHLLRRHKFVGVTEYPLPESALQELKERSPTVGLSRPDLFALLSGEDVLTCFNPLAPEGEKDRWLPVDNRKTAVAIDSWITEELAQEGMAREVIRHVQQLRKDGGLEMEDRIVLYLATDSARLKQAIEKHRDYIAAETLTVRWASSPLGLGSHRAIVKVDGQSLTIELRNAGSK